MAIKINYGNGVVVLPRAAVEKIGDAPQEYFSVLMTLLSLDGALALDRAEASEAVASALGMDTPTVDLAFEYWRGAGVISFSAKKGKTAKTEAQKAQTAPKKAEAKAEEVQEKKSRSAELPRYTTEQISDLLEKRKEAALLIDECQRILGKMFNTHEVNIVLGLIDYLSLDGEYVLTLFAHCAKIDKKSLHYIEKMAFNLYDSGIADTAQLTEYFRFLEKSEELVSKVRSIFGIGTRALSAKEKKILERWSREFDFTFDVIERAYEITVNATNSASLPYANSILESWHSKGYRTLEDVDAAEAERKAQKVEGSFDTDDFFEAALQRSYGDGSKK